MYIYTLPRSAHYQKWFCTREFNTEPTQQLMLTILQLGAVKKAGCIYMWSGKECQLLKRGGHTKQQEMPVTVLPNNNEQLRL
jgi:hypothetical protein